MVKKTSVLIILFLYVVSTAGFSMNFHFCGNTVSSFKINEAAKSCCDKVAKPMKCCKDKHVQVKISDSQQSSAFSKIPAASQLLLFINPLTADLASVYRYQTVKTAYLRAPSPPNTPAGILYCVFRI